MPHHTHTKRFEPVADPTAVVISGGGNTRFTVLTPALIRMEWSPSGTFEDHASFAFINRKLPVPRFDVTRHDGQLVITTDHLKLTYNAEHGGPFDADNLRVQVNVNGKVVTWTPGMPDTGNLHGTVRTLDGVDGACELEPGLLSRDGWVVVDDSQRLLFDNSAWPWALPRTAAKEGAQDWYFFGYGRDYSAALRDFTQIAGKIPLPPKYVFGSWWSRYWPYTDGELKALVGEFEKHDVPLDVLVIDMDWHLDGWTGYTWNSRYFPDPEAFLAWCREKGLRTTLNLHPADGVGKHEAAFRAMAAEMNVNTREVYRVPFDCTDHKFVDAYFKVLHHPLERQGIDFWWMDWQQGKNTKIDGLDPLFWLNYLHWSDFERPELQRVVPGRENVRPLIFSRWGGLGNHRYQIGFSGDTYNTWESLAFQSPFTATAANVGYTYWSHDIGGHQPGPVAPELYARWIQYAVFSPILRTHCGRRPDAERRIWAFPDDVFNVSRDAFHLRYALVPYIYTACRRTYDEAVALCRPLYHDWPELDQAYNHNGQYMFGDDLMIAPVSRPGVKTTGCAEMDVWLPPGQWTDWFTGRTYDAGKNGLDVRMLCPLDEYPLFVRSGAIIPMTTPTWRTTQAPRDLLQLHIFPGDEGKARLYEDDGVSAAYECGDCAWTDVSHAFSGGTRRVRIGQVAGEYAGMAHERTYEIHLRDTWPADSVSVNDEPLNKLTSDAARAGAAGWWYDAQTMSVIVRTPRRGVHTATEIAVTLSKVDHTPLRKGWRGQLKLVDDLVKLLGNATPQTLHDAVALRRIIAEDPARAASASASLQTNWWSLVHAVNTSTADSGPKASALARLLGFSCRMTVIPGIAGTLSVTADVAYAPRFEIDRTVSSTTSFRVSPTWSITSVTGGESKTLSIGGHARATATLKPIGVPQFGTISAAMTVNEENTTFTLSCQQTVFPSINAWWVVGPFDSPHEEELKRVHTPEQEFNPHAEYHGSRGMHVAWKKVERQTGSKQGPAADPRAEFFVDLQKTLNGQYEHVVAYAGTYLHAPRDMDAVLAIGSDDGVVAWVNGVEVHRNHIQRGYATREDRVKVRLRAGANLLLLKIGQVVGGWGFCVHVENDRGEPLTDVSVSLEP